jgi:UDP-N-acetylglucosamine diphosphorylase / glucose-1-phosphate thymidylyltransferase / UDP-N-acetylgalactosamine diphosphorylase / glucosamine-1-phosphate N-acetyltransferase / galactosamine-1-phosphate N-acetyltransferase
MSSKVMKAVILAAGRGTRMRELTDDLPKPMVIVHSKPVLQYIIEGLTVAGLDEILLVVGYRKEVVQDYFGDGSRHGIRIDYVEQVVQDGTGKVVELAKEFCGSAPFVLSYGDILVQPSTYPAFAKLDDAEMILAVRRSTEISKGGAVYLNSVFEVVDLREKQQAHEVTTPWYNAGIYTFKESIFSYVSRLKRSPRGEYELTDAVRAMAFEGRKIKAVEIKGDWTDVRDPEVLAELNRSFSSSSAGRAEL